MSKKKDIKADVLRELEEHIDYCVQLISFLKKEYKKTENEIPIENLLQQIYDEDEKDGK